jgi:hypothetical protein
MRLSPEAYSGLRRGRAVHDIPSHGKNGARHRDHEETRSRLVQSLAQQLLLAGGTHPSLRTLWNCRPGPIGFR